MEDIFTVVYKILMSISEFTGFSYKEVNIIVWYILIPFSWVLLIDKIIKKHYLKIIFTVMVLIALLFIKDFSSFSNSLFDSSADFLRALGDYVYASVIVCVFIPLIIYFMLIKKAFFNRKTL